MLKFNFNELRNDIEQLIDSESRLTPQLADRINCFVQSFYLGFDTKADFENLQLDIVAPSGVTEISIYQGFGRVTYDC